MTSTGFTLLYPSSWQKQENGLVDPDIVGISPKSLDASQFVVSAEYWPSLQTPKDFLISAVKEMPMSLPFTSVVQPVTETKLGAYPAYKMLESMYSETNSYD